MFERRHPRNFAEREKILPPRQILTEFGLRAGRRLADLGSGSGFFALPAAEMVGPGGMVAAVDIDTRALAELQKQAVLRRLDTILTTRGATGTGVPLPDGHVDVALIANVLHELDDPLAFLREAWRVLVDGGEVWIVEWQKKETPMGPPLAERKSVEEWTALIGEAGFRHIRARHYEPGHVLLTGEKRV